MEELQVRFPEEDEQEALYDEMVAALEQHGGEDEIAHRMMELWTPAAVLEYGGAWEGRNCRRDHGSMFVTRALRGGDPIQLAAAAGAPVQIEGFVVAQDVRVSQLVGDLLRAGLHLNEEFPIELCVMELRMLTERGQGFLAVDRVLISWDYIDRADGWSREQGEGVWLDEYIRLLSRCDGERAQRRTADALEALPGRNK